MTRPRPSVGPALAGVVDLSALKQRATQQGDSAPAAQAGVEITEANFEAEILLRSNEVPVVVLLWSPRSPSSVELADALSRLAATDGEKWSLARVNVDAAPRVGQIFGVQAVPAVMALAAGQPISNFQGAMPPDQLRKWVDAVVAATAGKLPGAADGEPEEVDPGLQQARDLLDAGNFDAALGAYQALLDSDPGNPEAVSVIRLITFQQRAAGTGPDAVRIADAAPDDIDAALAAADWEILQQQVAAAFNRLTALIRRTAGDDRTKVRTRLIELFELFDPADPEVVTGRRNLANALY